MNIKLILSLLSLVLAFVFTYILQGSGLEVYVVGALSVVGSGLGINWRQQYDDVKNWFASKTILGALLIALPTLVILVATIFNFGLPEEVKTILTYIIGAGGLGFLIGVADKLLKVKKEDEE